MFFWFVVRQACTALALCLKTRHVLVVQAEESFSTTYTNIHTNFASHYQFDVVRDLFREYVRV
ncbi:hypothetical protein BJV77DRAFT_1040642 [Russula vinacea]|nr:hypothetical protein BJV77DRAFT_1040642 [Russula vinacea]